MQSRGRDPKFLKEKFDLLGRDWYYAAALLGVNVDARVCQALLVVCEGRPLALAENPHLGGGPFARGSLISGDQFKINRATIALPVVFLKLSRLKFEFLSFPLHGLAELVELGLDLLRTNTLGTVAAAVRKQVLQPVAEDLVGHSEVKYFFPVKLGNPDNIGLALEANLVRAGTVHQVFLTVGLDFFALNPTCVSKWSLRSA